MFELKLDYSDFERKTADMAADLDQLPFALSVAMNKAADDTYNSLIEETWPNSVTVRNSNFIRWALRTKFSTKHDLSIAIYDNTPDQRAHLALHADGGIKTGKGDLAIPTSNVTLTSRGERTNQRPHNLANSFRVGNKIYQRVGRGKRSVAKLMYILAKSINQPQDVPFRTDFEKSMRDGIDRHFKDAINYAMRTRR